MKFGLERKTDEAELKFKNMLAVMMMMISESEPSEGYSGKVCVGFQCRLQYLQREKTKIRGNYFIREAFT